MRRFIPLVAALAIVSSCTKDEVEIISEKSISPAVLYAENESRTATKAYMNEWSQICWNAGDSISLFNGLEHVLYKFSGNDGDRKGQFTKNSYLPVGGGAEYSRYCAVYPYDETNSSPDESEILITFPSVQRKNAKKDVMVSETTSESKDSLMFKNACGWLVFNIKGEETIRRITLSGNNGEILAGSASITFQSDGFPMITMHGEDTQLCLDCGEEGQLLNASVATRFIFSLPPVTFDKGLSITIENIYEEQLIKTTDTKVSVNRNSIVSVKDFNIEISGTDLLSFAINDGSDVYQASEIGDSIIFVSLPPSSNFSSLGVSFTHNGAKAFIDDNPVKSGEYSGNFSDFSHEKYITIMSSDGRTQRYKITLFDLPALYIVTPGNEQIQHGSYTEGASIKLIDTDGKIVLNGSTQIKGRGNSTWYYTDKKAYAIKLDEKQKVLGMPKSKRWNLLASAYDRTLIRNDVTFEISRRTTGLEWSPRGKHIEFVLNGKHMGNYYLMESVKIDNKRIDIDEMKTSDTTGINKTGGYVLEFTRIPEKYHFISKNYKYDISLTSPDEDVPDQQLDYIESFINEVEDLLYDDDKVLAREYLEYIDIESLIDWWLVHEIAHSTEQVAYPPLSAYMYKGRNKIEGGVEIITPLKAGPVWDFDKPTYDYLHYTAFIGKHGLYIPSLLKDPVFIARAKEKWSDLRTAVLSSTTIYEYIDSKYDELQKSAYRDEGMWPVPSIGNSDNAMPYSESISKMKEYLENRIKWIDDNIDNL